MTSSKAINNIISWFSLFFLLVSIISYIVHEKDFGLNTFTGTDALTLYGMIIALATLIAMKLNWVRKVVRKILLKFNFKKFNYEMSTVLDTNVDINKLHKTIQTTLKKTDYFSEKETELLNKTGILIRFSSAAMGCNITIKEQSMTSDYKREHIEYANRFKLEFKGKDDYRGFKKNSDFILNILIDRLQKEGMDFNKYYLKVKKKEEDYNYLNENYLLVDKSFKVAYSETQITKTNVTIIINKTEGIAITSTSKGDFNIGLGLLEDLLVN